MKKYSIGLAITIAIAISTLIGQATTLASSIHTVKPGDTLWEIARDNHISVEDLRTWNNLDSTLIFPTQELKIENKVETYTVKKGDTLSEIAENHHISLTELMRWNDISDHLIYPGEQLILEDGKIPAPQSNVQSSQAKATPSPSAEKSKKETEQPTVSKTPAPNTTGKEMSVTATAYTAYCTGCSGITYTGIDLRSNPNQKVIAVDPSIIPLGSRVWVEGYGEAIAGDIGGAIKGNIIDVFLENQQDALNWGRRTVTIKILD